MQDILPLAKQRHSHEESVGQAMSSVSPECWGSRVYLGDDEFRYKSFKQRGRPMFWTCAARFGCDLTTAKGVSVFLRSVNYQGVGFSRLIWVAYTWISFGLIVIKTERAIQPGKCASQKGLTYLGDRSEVWRREVREDDLQDIKVEAFRGDHCFQARRSETRLPSPHAYRPATPGRG